MKPRTKLHHRVLELSKILVPITEKQKQWAYKNCLNHLGYANKNRVLCLDCGETFSPQLVKRNSATCPRCQTKLKIKESRCTTDTQINFFAITEIVDEFQVIRNFELIANYKKGKKVNYSLKEILQDWIQPDLKVTKFGLKHHCTGFCDSWTGKMEIREGSRYSYYGAKYDVYARMYHPSSKFKPEYLKIGINKNLSGLSFIEAITKVPNKPRLETLLKAKRYDFLHARESKINQYWNTIKICLRNKYKPNDIKDYFDYLDLLGYFNRDLLNAKYVCPKNLKKEHNRYVKKKIELQRKRDYEKSKKLIDTNNPIYIEQKQKFFDLVFSDSNIQIIPLKSVHEFLIEGQKLTHCVFTNSYYKKQDSLILSARIKNEPIETIEIDLKKMVVSQARGLGNKPTKYHDKIVELVNKNMHKIRAIVKPKKEKLIKKLAS